MSYFHMFEWKSFILKNANDSIEKFDARASEGIFLIYSVASKIDHVFNKDSRAVDQSMNVRFKDDQWGTQADDCEDIMQISPPILVNNNNHNQ